MLRFVGGGPTTKKKEKILKIWMLMILHKMQHRQLKNYINLDLFDTKKCIFVLLKVEVIRCKIE